MSDKLALGDVIITAFPEHTPPGREQQGYRPAVVVGLPEALGTPRYSVLFVVPMTTDRGQGWATASPDLYPRLEAGVGNLPKASILLLDQACSLDYQRVRRRLGTLSSKEYQPISEGLKKMLSL